MADTGSLIQLHYHQNFDIIEQLSDSDGALYYKDAPIFPTISTRNGNALSKLTDGFYVNGTTMLSTTQYNLLSRFSYNDSHLLFNGTVVLQENTITDEELQQAISDTINILREG